MDLKQWLKDHKISAPDFARRIGLSHAPSIYRYLDRTQVPRPKFMAAIIRETSGDVSANDFVAADTPRRDQPRKAS